LLKKCPLFKKRGRPKNYLGLKDKNLSGDLLVEKILVGMDDSKQSFNALRYAISEAKKKGLKKITVVHSEPRRSPEEMTKEDLAISRKILEIAESMGKKAKLRVKTQLLTRGLTPDTDIVKFAEENNCNHIIIGSMGRSGISRILLGSVAEGVVEKAHCVVTVVRGI